MKIRDRMLVVMFGFLVPVTLGCTAILYLTERDTYYAAVDRELRTAALMARDLLPPDYHDRIVNRSSVSSVEYQRIVDRFNRRCAEAELEYLWSLMVLDGKIVFTSGTATSKDVTRGDYAAFLEPHSNPELYTNAFKTMQPQAQMNADKWGRIRAVLVPFRDGHGRPCLMGASRSMQKVDAQLRSVLISSAVAGGSVLALGVVCCLMLARSLSRPVEAVTAAAAAIARGDFARRVPLGGAHELELLGTSINHMSQAVQDRVRELAESRELLRATLLSIGDAVIATDAQGKITWMNPVAEQLTGWAQSQAQGVALEEAFRIVNSATRQPVENPVAAVLRKGSIVELANHTVLLARDGREHQIADSAAPIRDRQGAISGVVLVFRDVTETYRKDQALRLSEERHRALFKHSPDAVMLIEADANGLPGKFLEANDTLCERLGYTREELLQMTVADIDAPEAVSRIPERAARLSANATVVWEGAHQSRLGRIIPVEISGHLIQMEGRWAILATARDITKRQQAAARLLESEFRQRTILNSIPDPAWLKDAAGRYMMVNEAWCQFTGRAAAETIGKMDREWRTAAAARGMEVEDRKVVQSGKPVRLDQIMSDTQGQPRVFETIKTPIVDEQGKVTGTAGIARDITARRQAEQALRSAEQRYRSLFENALEGVYQTTLAGAFQSVNPAMAQILGYASPEELTSERTDIAVQGYVNPSDREEFRRRVEADGKVTGFEYQARRKDGQIIWVSENARVLRDEQGKAIGYEGTMQDVTEAKRMQAERERLTRELARKHRELEGVLYATSHDLRSPLLNIQGFGRRLAQACGELTDLLKQAEVPESVREQAQPITENRIPKALQFIEASIGRLDALIAGLLRLSRLGQVEMCSAVLDVNQLLSRVIAAAAFQVQAAEAVVEVEPLPSCQGDAALVSQVFANLLDNALKYRDPARPLRIHISGQVSQHRSVYCIADTGLGLEPEEQVKIWNMFQRLHPSGSVAGDGLGLTLVRRVVERHDGLAWVESTPGEGSQFYISLPAPPAGAGSPEVPA